MLTNYLKIAVRNLWKNKVYSGVNIIGLALGLACCMAIGLYVLDEFRYDRFHTNYERIYRIVERQEQPGGLFNVAVTPGPLAPTLANDFPEIAQTTRIGNWSGMLSRANPRRANPRRGPSSRGEQNIEASSMLIVDPSFFTLFSFPLVAGNVQKALAGPDDVVISESMAERLFGPDWSRQGIIGQPLEFNKERVVTLVGVAKNPPVQSQIQFDVLLPYKWLETTDPWSQKWNSNNFHTYVLLHPNRAGTPVDVTAFAGKLSGQLSRYNPETKDVLLLQPLRDIYLKSNFDFKTDWRDVQQLPGVAVASTTTSYLVDMVNGSNIEWEGQQLKDEFLITHMNIDADFMQTTGMALAAGRNFSAQIPSDTSSTLSAFMINETAAKRMNWTPAQAIGKRLTFQGPSGIVVGVLKDFHFRPLRAPIEPFLFWFSPRNLYFNLLVRTIPGSSVQRTVAGVSALYKKYEPNSPISYGFVDQELDAQYRAEQRTGRIILYFSILAIFVSCLGLFGLATFTAEQRTKEIGVRKVLGASVGSIVALLSKDFLKLVLIAIVIASPVAYYAMHRWLQEFAYRIDIEWWVFALAGLLAVGIALLTVSFQSIRAALMNPVKSLRSE